MKQSIHAAISAALLWCCLALNAIAASTTQPAATAPAYKVAPPAGPSTKPVQTVYYVAPGGSDANPGTEAKPWKTPRIPASHVKLLIQAAGIYPTGGIFIGGKTDVSIDDYGTGALPVLTGNADVNIFSFDASSARISIAHVRCDSAWTWTATAGGYRYHLPKAAFGIVRGADVTIEGVELANLTEGISVQGVNRILIDQVNQADVLGMPSRCVYVDTASDFTLTNSKFLNSIGESPLRATGGGITRGLIKGNSIAQQLDAAHGRSLAKAAVTIRQADQLMFQNNTVTDGELSFNTDITGKQIISNSTIEGGSVIGSQLTIRPGCQNITVVGLVVTNLTGSECVADSAGAAGIIYNDLNLAGSNCGIKFYQPGNAIVESCHWAGTVANLPLIKGEIAGVKVGN